MSDSSPPSSFEVEFEKLRAAVRERSPTPIHDVVEPALVDTSASMRAASPKDDSVSVTVGEGDKKAAEEGKIAIVRFDHPPTNADIDREIAKVNLTGKDHVLVEVWTPMNAKERARVSSRAIEKVKQLSAKQKVGFTGHVVLLRPSPDNMPTEEAERREVIRLLFEEPRNVEQLAKNVKKLSETAANRIIEVSPAPEDESELRQTVTRYVDEFNDGKLPFGAKAYVEMWAKPKGDLESPQMPARRIKYYHVPKPVDAPNPLEINFYALPPTPDMMRRVLKELDLKPEVPLKVRLHNVKAHEHMFGTIYFVAALAGAEKNLWPIDDSTCIAWPYPEPNHAVITVRFAKSATPMPRVEGVDYSVFKLRVAKLKASPKDIARFMEDWEKQMTTVSSKATRVSPIPPEGGDEWKLVSHAKKKKKKRASCSQQVVEEFENSDESDIDPAPAEQKRLNIFMH